MSNSTAVQKFYHNFTNKYYDEKDLAKPSREIASAISNYTKKQVENVIGVKTMAAQGGAAGGIGVNQDHQYIKYTPNSQNIHATPTQRIIKMKEVQKDPLQPAAFKHKRIPKGLGSPPTTIMHSPPRKITVKDQQDWKIPPCISNWKNAKGYTIPLDMRISADGRTLQNHTVNEKFAQLADALHVTERLARKDIEERNKLQKSVAYKEHLRKEEEMRAAATRAREEKNQLFSRSLVGTDGRKPTEDVEEDEDKKNRDMYRHMRKREIEREKRQEASGYNKSKAARDAERDISEKIALGQAQPTNNEVMFDQRLFNQSAGLDSGFISDDENNLYDKPLFNDRTAASIYKNVRKGGDDDDENDDKPGKKEKSEVERILSRNPARGFEGAEKRAEPRTKPVEFEKHGDDIFGMDSFVHEARKRQKM